MISQRVIKSLLFSILIIQSGAVTGQVWFKQSGDYYALMSQDSQYISGFIYTEVSEFSEGLAWVNKGDLYCYINSDGDSITSFVFSDVSDFNHGFAVVSMDSTYGVINRFGQLVVEYQYSRINTTKFGFFAAQQDSVWHVIDTAGMVVSNRAWLYPPFFLSDNFIVGCVNGLWGVVNANDEVLYEFKHDLITYDGVAYIKNEKYLLGLR